VVGRLRSDVQSRRFGGISRGWTNRRGAIHTKERSHVGLGDHGTPATGGTTSRLGLPVAGPIQTAPSGAPDYDGFDDRLLAGGDEADFDSIEEVDAVARSVRKKGLQYSAAILLLLLTVPVLAWLGPRWFARPVWGGLTLNFLTVAVLLHFAFVVVAILYARVANRSEDEMLGRPEGDG